MRKGSSGQKLKRSGEISTLMKGNVAKLFINYAKEVEVQLEDLQAERRGLLSASSARRWHLQKPKSPRSPIPRKPYMTSSAVSVSTSSAPELYQELWEAHEKQWAIFESFTPDVITFACIPFPPCDSDVLDFLREFNRSLDAKAVYQLACRRWHPDKFMQAFGSRIFKNDVQAINERLNSISQEINVKWNAEKLRQARLASSNYTVLDFPISR